MPEPIFVGRGSKDVHLLPKMGNRHGLVAGATGTGKTVTLQRLAEGFSRIGVPAFLADVKGDLSGICRSGSPPKPPVAERIKQFGLTDFSFDPCPVVFWTCSASRATRCGPPSPRWGRCCCRGCST